MNNSRYVGRDARETKELILLRVVKSIAELHGYEPLIFQVNK